MTQIELLELTKEVRAAKEKLELRECAVTSAETEAKAAKVDYEQLLDKYNNQMCPFKVGDKVEWEYSFYRGHQERHVGIFRGIESGTFKPIIYKMNKNGTASRRRYVYALPDGYEDLKLATY